MSIMFLIIQIDSIRSISVRLDYLDLMDLFMPKEMCIWRMVPKFQDLIWCDIQFYMRA